MGTLMFTLSFLLQEDRHTHTRSDSGYCWVKGHNKQLRSVRFSLLVSQEELDDGVGFELHLVHVGVLVLQHLQVETDRWTFTNKKGGNCSVKDHNQFVLVSLNVCTGS